MWGGMKRIFEEKPDFVDWVLEEVRSNGPLTAREVEHHVPRDGTSEKDDNWGWNWSEVKMALTLNHRSPPPCSVATRM